MSVAADADLPTPDRRVTDRLMLTGDGRVIDFLDPSHTRANTPEERVRQNFVRMLHYQYGYPKEEMTLGPLSTWAQIDCLPISLSTMMLLQPNAETRVEFS